MCDEQNPPYELLAPREVSIMVAITYLVHNAVICVVAVVGMGVDMVAVVAMGSDVVRVVIVVTRMGSQ